VSEGRKEKAMPNKDPCDSQYTIWIIIITFSIWGGVVRYLIRINHQKKQPNWIGVISQIIISGFTGLLGGLLSVESGTSYYMTLFFSGLFGAMGNSAINYLWRRFFPP
jgi:uncharacterized membrane protein YjjP (DUF1212 family)